MKRPSTCSRQLTQERRPGTPTFPVSRCELLRRCSKQSSQPLAGTHAPRQQAAEKCCMVPAQAYRRLFTRLSPPLSSPPPPPPPPAHVFPPARMTPCRCRLFYPSRPLTRVRHHVPGADEAVAAHSGGYRHAALLRSSPLAETRACRAAASPPPPKRLDIRIRSRLARRQQHELLPPQAPALQPPGVSRLPWLRCCY